MKRTTILTQILRGNNRHTTLPPPPPSSPFSSSPPSHIIHNTPLRSTHKRQIIIIGGGHNGLIASAYLAARHYDVLLLERRHLVGGAAVTESDIFSSTCPTSTSTDSTPYKISRASYVAGLLRPDIIRDLSLVERGLLRYLPRRVASFTPCHPDNQDDPSSSSSSPLILYGGDNDDETMRSIATHSPRDAERWMHYENFLSRCRDVLIPSLIDRPLPDVSALIDPHRRWKCRRDAISDSLSLLRHAWDKKTSLNSFFQIMAQPAARVLDSWFDSPVLKATLACDACIGNGSSVYEAGTGYALLHLVMGETMGREGAWSYVEGGMGAISEAVRKVAEERGVEIVTDATVESIVVDDRGRKATGVVLTDGTRIEADVVMSNATPYHTFLELLPADALSEGERRALSSQDYSGGAMKINCITNRLPEFECFPTYGAVGPPHLGTVHFEHDMSQLHKAAMEAKSGIPATHPVIEMAIPTSIDQTLAPPGQHVVQFFVQYTPYHLTNGQKWDDIKDRYVDDVVFALIERYCPGFISSVMHRDVLSPLDLERIFNLHQGNIYHGSHRIDQIGFWRPMAGWGSHRSPVRGLYLCGAGCHPGGGVMGASGRNAATVVMRDIENGYV